jgi:hypothetical protein
MSPPTKSLWTTPTVQRFGSFAEATQQGKQFGNFDGLVLVPQNQNLCTPGACTS